MKTDQLLSLFCFSCSIFCLTEGVKLKKLRVRRQSCNSTYIHNGIACCQCPKGYHVKKHCTQPRTDSECDTCEEGFYKDHENGDINCDPCTFCEPEAYMENQVKCTPFYNAVCQCQDGYFCDKGPDCKVCYACKECAGMEVKVPCNVTSDTVCIEKTSHDSTITAVVIVAVLLIPSLVVFILWKKNKLSFKKKSQEPVREQELVPLADVDLADFLPEIAEQLGWKTVMNVVTRTQMLNEVEIENLKETRDAYERTLEALRMWYQKHGVKKAYQTLVNNLNKTSYKAAAEKVQQIVKRGAQEEKTRVVF